MNRWQTTAAAAVGVVTGTIYNAQHHPEPAAKVYLQSLDKTEGTALTDSAGVYQFSVVSGTYTVRVEGSAATITVKPNTITTADLTVQPPFFDEPQYTAADVTDYTYRGGHGADSVFRSTETITRALKKEQPEGDSKETTLYAQATDLLSHRKAREAAELYAQGVNLFPSSLRMLLGMASACYAQASYDEAAQWFFRATDLAPHDPKAYLFLGEVQARQITGSEGYKVRMARFAKDHPEMALANYYYARTLPDDKARNVFRKATQLDPQLAVAYIQLGAIALREHNYVEAAGNYRAAIAIEPDLEEAHYRLAEAYRLNGEPSKAKQELTIFQRLSKASAAHQ